MTEILNTEPTAACADGSVEVAAAAGQPSLPLAYLGHDLRAALAEMRAGLSLLCELVFPDTVQDTLRRCVASGEALTRLIDQSVLVCLGEASPGLTQPSEIVTDELLATLQRRWALQAMSSGHRFELDAAPGLPPTFRMDRAALDRILSNLLTNALRHTPPGAVTLSLSKDQTGKALCIDLADRGPGFSSGQIDSLSQGLGAPAAAARPGGGLGLQSVAFLVQALGGHVAFGNGAAGGALIRLRLPLVSPEVGPQVSQSAAATQDGLAPVGSLTGLRVLVAEDNLTLREVIAKQLNMLGAKVTEVADGQAAVQALSVSPSLAELLILDEEMPGQSGLDVLDWIGRHLPPNHRPAVLALTCHPSAERITALMQAGAALVRSKPILDVQELETILRETLAIRAGQPAPAPMAEPFPALRRLAEIAGPAAAEELFLRLGEDLERVRAGLARATKDGDANAIRQHSHVLIALAGTAGATVLHDDAVRLNGLAHAGGAPERLMALAAALDGGIGSLLGAVHDMTPQAHTTTGRP